MVRGGVPIGLDHALLPQDRGGEDGRADHRDDGDAGRAEPCGIAGRDADPAEVRVTEGGVRVSEVAEDRQQ